VIVSYRCQGYLRRCLKSLESHAPAGTNVCIVDNDSRDGTVEMVRAKFPEVDVIENATNLGFARATNLGIRRGMSPYVLVLNPDTQIFRGTLDCLLAVLEENPEVAAVGPRLVRPDGSCDHAARRSFPTLLGALGHFTGVGRLVNRGSLAQYRAPLGRAGTVGRDQRRVHAHPARCP
jgi:N-acetylglucosaminyl-diphospho-decaprenol L-rhamnosyltransferase